MEADKKDYEYAAFVWDKTAMGYVMFGLPVGSEYLCRIRFERRIRDGLVPPNLDTSNILVLKRSVIITKGDWEDVEEEECAFQN